jgi:hypothetical protein
MFIGVIKSRRFRWAGHIVLYCEMKIEYTILFAKPEGKRPLRRRSVNGRTLLKSILKGIGCEGVEYEESEIGL